MVETKFKLKELPKHIQSFGFIAGYEKKEYREEDPINVKAVAAIGNLYEQLQGNNYPTNDSVVFLTRIVFCLFADDTGIFSPDTLKFYIEDRTNVDGSDLGYHINTIFEILNTPLSSRQNNIDESLVSLPYVNGGLFSERITPLAASSELRRELLRVMKFDWSEISPAIFGSMFQSVMDEEARHNLGAHYTSEKNILEAHS